MPRRRGGVLDQAIRSAVLELVIDHSVAGVTMETVVYRAGTSKPVVYRRWYSRSALLRESLVQLATEAIPHRYRQLSQ